MKLKKCPNAHYTLKAECSICKKPTSDAHYKFIKIKSLKESSIESQS